jgi:glycosyltransferase involved in cell wall biosynthesis
MNFRLFTTEWAPRRNGISTFTQGLARALHAAGHGVHVHARAPLPADPFPVHPMPGRSWSRWSGAWGWLASRALAPGEIPFFSTWPLATWTRFPCLVAWHGSDLARPAGAPGRDDVAARAVNLPVSAFLASKLPRHHAVLPAPIDPQPRARRGERLLVICRLVETKGVDTALRYAAAVARPITVVGEGPLEPELRSLAASLGVDATFLPADTDPPFDGTYALLQFSRPYADGSGAEGLGLTCLEAAARGIPSIATRCGGLPEVADLVLDDPLAEVETQLPTPRQVQERLAARHGTDRAVRALVEAAALLQ